MKFGHNLHKTNTDTQEKTGPAETYRDNNIGVLKKINRNRQQCSKVSFSFCKEACQTKRLVI
jgi:hypothetical protein